MPDQPLLIFDGRCGFCRIWIEYWKQLTGSKVAYAPSQEAGADFPEIRPGEIQRIRTVGIAGRRRALRGTRRVRHARYAPGMAWLLWLYTRVPGFAGITEAGYRFIASHRNFFYQVTRFTFGRRVSPLRTARVEWLFLRILAMIYFIAFVSLAVQITGLVGAARHSCRQAVSRWRAACARRTKPIPSFPTLFWFAHSDAFLRTSCCGRSRSGNRAAAWASWSATP